MEEILVAVVICSLLTVAITNALHKIWFVRISVLVEKTQDEIFREVSEMVKRRPL